MTIKHRIAALECATRQAAEKVGEPPEGLTIEIVLEVGLKARCMIVDGDNFRPYLPDFPDPYWRNAAAWLNRLRLFHRLTAAELVKELESYDAQTPN